MTASVIPARGSVEAGAPEPIDGLRALAQALIGPAEKDDPLLGPPSPEPEAQLVLRLDELVADDRGEIVLSPGDGVRQLVIETMDKGMTSPGFADRSDPSLRDVEGMSRMTIGNGTTIFFPADLEVLVVSSLE